MPYPSRLLGGAVRAEVASSAAVSPCGWLGALAMVKEVVAVILVAYGRALSRFPHCERIRNRSGGRRLE